MGHARQQLYSVTLDRRRQLTSNTFELQFSRPTGLAFKPGQKITLVHGDLRRDYSLIGAADDPSLSICVRRVPDGRLTPELARAQVGQPFEVTAPFGFFLFRPSDRRPVFVATGTGIAPFVAFSRSGVSGFILLHGVRSQRQLYYARELRRAARLYLPCISGADSSELPQLPAHDGRTSDYIEHHLDPGRYDFYLCGRSEMIRDVTRTIDLKFSDARVFTEIFY